MLIQFSRSLVTPYPSGHSCDAQAALCDVSLLTVAFEHNTHAATPLPLLATKPIPAAHSSQALPENPLVHVQLYALTPSTHAPPIRQGFGLHSLMFVSQFEPE